MSVTDLHGSGFVTGATVKLTRAGSSDIAATNVTVASANQITCDLNLAGAAIGAWNVEVANPDASWGSLPNGFFVGRASGIGWGGNGYGECNFPGGIDYVEADMGQYHSVALRNDGSITAWGWNGNGELNVPPGNNFTGVSAGMFFNLAVRSDGTLAAWGRNNYGQCNVPAGNDYVAVAAGSFHGLAIRRDGSLAAWGDNEDGQCNVPAGNNYIAIAAGAFHSLALRADGSIAAWGTNGNGQCNVPAGSFTAIAAGDWHSLAVKADGSLAAWGWNIYGQCSVPAGTFMEVAGGAYHSLALKTDGSLAAWGYNDAGQLGVPAGNDFVGIGAGNSHCLALRSAKRVNASVSGGHGSVDPTFQELSYEGTASIDLVPDAGYGVFSITDNGAKQAIADPYVIGGVTGDHNVVATFAPPAVDSVLPKYSGNGTSVHLSDLHGSSFLNGAGVKLTRAGSADITATNVVVDSSTRITCDLDLTGAATGAWNVVVTNPGGVAGSLNGCFFVGTMAGTGWGGNGSGESDVPAGYDFVAITAGWSHSLALESDGSLAAWGWDGYGQVGNTPRRQRLRRDRLGVGLQPGPAHRRLPYRLGR